MSTENIRTGEYWHCSHSFNVSPALASRFSIALMATEITRRFGALGLVTSKDGRSLAPSGHANPEVKIIPLSWVVNRKVISVDVWVKAAVSGLEGAMVNLAAAEAFKVASRDTSLSAQRIAGGLNTCSDLTEWFRTNAARVAAAPAALLAAPAIYALNRATDGALLRDAAVATVCATYELFQVGRPPPEATITGGGGGVLSTAGAAVAAGPIEQSTTPGQVGTSPPAFHMPVFDWPISASAVTWTLVALGSVVGLFIVGYTARGVSGLIREVK
jgi:hypothetical protein